MNLFFQRAIPRNKALVTEPKTSPVPKIEATAKTLDLNQIPQENNMKSTTIRQFPTNDFKAK